MRREEIVWWSFNGMVLGRREYVRRGDCVGEFQWNGVREVYGEMRL